MDNESVWAVCELMGHVKLAGRLTEVERFGVKMGRLDIPQLRKSDCPNCTDESAAQAPCPVCGAGSFITQYFGGQSVYRISIVTEEVARHVCRQTSPAPVSPWDFPKQLSAPIPEPGRNPHDDDAEWGPPDEDSSDLE